ncbi:hypothetical protein Lepto7376_2289 [[Leptolyngbya] sp. PCC 7376]|uniref:prepilin-type N-terminal cleavage/methylation domain-containing protein n=1 Tax=[Leptolyngbya] sp. PCC 7376 TaxID=111781 RepID=UPI00029F0C68|nr:prepilin-type N-terminal cleavage/methylation domain-containing protein [[Leptolyngbya] sp. PCC 7376]AFY38579.1 hypothetical protein Lepto7376_2289 [[Leptolyngbya] sp. PCC 7376]
MNNNQDQGFTLLELLVALAIIGILSAITTPLVLWANKPLQNATYQAAGIFSQGRSRAIATTSSIRIQPDPSDPDHSLIVEASDTRSCDPNTTQLTGAVPTTGNQLTVVSTNGFAAGDRLKVGDDETENVVLTTDSSTSVLTLGQPLGTSQASGEAVEIISTWTSDKTFFQEDMTLPDTVTIASNLNNWVLCFDSRGIASVSDDTGITTDDLEITLISEQSAKEGKITVFQGGLIDSVVIQPKPEVVVASASDTGTSTSDDSSSGTGSDSSSTGGGSDSATSSEDDASTEADDTSTDPEASTETETSTEPDDTSTEPEAIAEETEYELDNGVVVTVDDSSPIPPDPDPEPATTDPEPAATDPEPAATDITPPDNTSPDDEEPQTYEEKLVVYREWLDDNEYYQSLVEGTQTVDRDSEPYKNFITELIEKLTWLYS